MELSLQTAQSFGSMEARTFGSGGFEEHYRECEKYHLIRMFGGNLS